ncbi:MAG: trypsin-like peptidase domain-containing protein [Verrucomicrobiota bacterium]
MKTCPPDVTYARFPDSSRQRKVRSLLICGVLAWACAIESSWGMGDDVRRDAAVRAVENVLPSIVNISTETLVEVRDPLAELFQDFFGPYYRRRPADAQKSLGSGVIIDEAGYIITNYHVVRRANRITVTLVDGREFEAQAVSRTAKSDVALLKLVTRSDEKFHAIRFAADDDLLLGETVLALGNPFGLGVSVSRGILSSKTRRPPVENEPLEMEDWLQTDAAINPGNSGGPLVNLKGELIGLNVAVFREGQGIGFAIPVKRLSEAVSEIFTPEEVRNLWFGGRFKRSGSGVVVASVEPGSPADKAGLRAGDVVVKANEQAAHSLVELNREIATAGEKRDLRLQILRKDERKDLLVRLIPEKDVFNASLIRQKLGVTVQELPAEVATQMDLPTTEGLLIAAVEKNSPAAHANLARGYVLRAIDGRPAEGIKEAARQLYGRKAGDVVELNVVVSRLRGHYVQVYPAKVQVALR